MIERKRKGTALTEGPQQKIRIAAAIASNTDGQLLLVRKRGTTAFMQPGGKLDHGETARQCLLRELREELGLNLAESQVAYIGTATAPAANEADTIVTAHLFQIHPGAIKTGDAVAPAAEIEETRWIDPTEPGDLELAPLTRNHVLPLYRSQQATTEDGG